MKFRTEIEIAPFPSEARIGYGNRILALGSCFAEEMTARLRQLRFACTINPSGVLFNPASVTEALRSYAGAVPVRREELHEQEGLWFHFGFHGSFSDTEPDVALARMNAARRAGAEALRTADRVLLTFGTAWVYQRDGKIVANCHRRPAAEFVRRRLSVAEIVAAYDELLRTVLAGKQVILTVSPVRHAGDGLAENCAGKAVLRLAAEELAERHGNVRYFPAYEILRTTCAITVSMPPTSCIPLRRRWSISGKNSRRRHWTNGRGRSRQRRHGSPQPPRTARKTLAAKPSASFAGAK